jgi:dihydromethanopterin reductase
MPRIAVVVDQFLHHGTLGSCSPLCFWNRLVCRCPLRPGYCRWMDTAALIVPLVYPLETLKARKVLMQVTDVRAVIAIGLSGQFSLRGRLPWEGNRGREYVADVERFFELTRGHVLIMGHRTFSSVPDFAFQNRDIIEIHSSDTPEEVLARFPSRVVFIGGGPPVYAAYAPFIRHWDISRLPYDGEADRWFDPNWLVADGRT